MRVLSIGPSSVKMGPRQHPLRWWLFGAVLWLSERTGCRGMLRIAVWAAHSAAVKRRPLIHGHAAEPRKKMP